MTRKEAIYWLEHEDINRVKFYTAVGYALEALKDIEEKEQRSRKKFNPLDYEDFYCESLNG